MHQKDIHEINQENRDISFSECDGIYTRSPGIIIATVCADCPVIILMGEGECASLHSGWRGTKVHIAHAGIERFTTSREDIRVYI